MTYKIQCKELLTGMWWDSFLGTFPDEHSAMIAAKEVFPKRETRVVPA